MKQFRGNSIGEAWMTLLNDLIRCRCVSPRGQDTYELCGISIRVEDMRQNVLVHPKRNMNYRFMVAEWLWIVFGYDNLDMLCRYNKQMAQFSDNGLTLAGAYGPRLFSQWEWIVAKLKADRATRQAVVSIWTPAPYPSKDIPCTLSMQFLIRNGDLNCIVNMRSSDVWLGIPYDFFTFSMLANSLAGQLGVTPGWLQINMGSSHLYSTDIHNANAVLMDYTSVETVMSPSLPGKPDEYLRYILNDKNERPVLLNPWLTYGSCLQFSTSADALEVLRDLSPANT